MSPMWRDLTWLQSALRDMTERERTVFVMSELEGRSRAEIATTCLISPDEVDSRIQAAYARLERGMCVARIRAEPWAPGRMIGN
jgi:DNA-directed RNA polymerase specialized sigma24 family protein